ncbi:MAG: hypothetical protein O7B81_11120, partial [Gammaproteobacteria bacterium]|nr:hypothetical protein [Gammaproteobacteria bacterium]
FVYFKPWDPPDGEIDLLLCGIGNSMFASTLSQELLRFVERARHAVGIFGTQYRTRIDPVLMAGLLDRLELWFARYQEDALIYGKRRSNVFWLGDWLIDAFPLSPWTRDERLDLTSVRLGDLALDRAIQRIQTYREVISPQIHPLLCALTSAQRCAYVEQHEDSSGEASGKFRSQLLDIFGREYPERTMFEVDSELVARYKSKVRHGIADLRERIHALLSGSWQGATRDEHPWGKSETTKD